MKENIKLICFDLDDTLILANSWKKLGLALGLSVEEDRRLYKEYKSGLITYDEWNDKVIEKYMEHEDSTRSGITKILSGYSFKEGARETINYIKYYKANNTFVFDENDRLIGVHSNGDDVLAKVDHLESFCEMLDIDIKECACIADGDNDIEMFRRTGHGITFKGQEIEKEAWKVIDSFEDLKGIF